MKRKYQKTVVIEAEQFDPTDAEQLKRYENSIGFNLYTAGYYINTLEGRLALVPGCWLITGVAGEVYPCDDAIFRKSYEEVNNEVKNG